MFCFSSIIHLEPELPDLRQLRILSFLSSACLHENHCFLWHEALIGQWLHRFPQELLPCFLSLISPLMIRPMIRISTRLTMIVPMFSDNHKDISGSIPVSGSAQLFRQFGGFRVLLDKEHVQDHTESCRSNDHSKNVRVPA